MNQAENDDRPQDSSEYTEEWLSAYLDDELTDTQRAIVEQRLASDSETQQLLDDLQRVRGLVNQLPAWSGKLISASEITHNSGVSTVAANVATGNDDGSLGDYHDELQPSPDVMLQAELQLHSESIAETLEQEGDSSSVNFDAPSDATRLAKPTSLESFAFSGQRRSASWLRPLVLAACLLLLVGGGAWFLNSGPSWTVATSTGVSRESPETSFSAASDPMKAEIEFGLEANSQEMPFAAAADSLGSAPLSVPSADLSPDGMAREQAPIVAGIPSPEPPLTRKKAMRGRSSGGNAEGSLSENLANNAREIPNEHVTEPGTDGLRAYGGGSSAEAAMQPNTETGALGLRGQGRTGTKVQMAHSAGWSANDIEAALERLAPLLNLPTSPPTDRAIANSVAAIPIAIVTSKAPVTGATPLDQTLQQQAVPLQEVVPADTLPRAWQSPFAQSLADEPSTVALFVLRGEAEQILQVAQEAGELVNNPVWISSASGAATPAGPKQQVVLLFAPQY